MPNSSLQDPATTKEQKSHTVKNCPLFRIIIMLISERMAQKQNKQTNKLTKQLEELRTAKPTCCFIDPVSKLGYED